MVDFSKAINNRDMAEGLKKLLVMNARLVEKCEILKRYSSNNITREYLTELADLHRDHMKLFADSILFLGSSPDMAKGSTKERWYKIIYSIKIGLFNGSLSDLKRHEEKLDREYRNKLQEFKASDEVVTVINKALGDNETIATLFYLRGVPVSILNYKQPNTE